MRIALIITVLLAVFAILPLSANPSVPDPGGFIAVQIEGKSDELSLQQSMPPGLKRLQPLFSPKNIELAKQTGLDRWFVSQTRPTMELMRQLKGNPAVRDVIQPGEVRLATTPNDPLFSQQWGLNNTGNPVGTPGADIRALQAWQITTGNPAVTIAFLDTGIDLTHLELAPNIVPGYNFVSSNTNTQDDQGHGTRCAGITGAVGNNNLQMAGVGWNMKLMPVKVVTSSGTGNDLWLAQGITWAADNGANVISASLVTSSNAPYLRNAVNYAVASGVTIVAATGNDGQQVVMYPAGYQNVIAVGASTQFDNRAGFSNYGTHVDVVAPGIDIVTTNMGGGTINNFAGTSAATPFVAGICGLVLSVNPNVTPSEMQELIRQGADDVNAAGFDIFTGYGRANAYGTLMALLDNSAPSQPVVSVPGPYTGNPSEISFSWTESTSPQGQIAGYEYAIGTEEDPLNIRIWTTVGNVLSYTATGLNLQPGIFYIVSVRAKNEFGITGPAGVSDPVIYSSSLASVGLALSQPDDAYVTLTDKVVTAAFADRTYITEPLRSASIGVLGAFGVSEGQILSVSGKMTTIDGMRVIIEPEVTLHSIGDAVRPLHLVQINAGGSDLNEFTPGITGGRGLYNLGQLVKVWGKVMEVGADTFYIDDGSGLVGFEGQEGIRVKAGGASLPAKGSQAAVTGILECEESGEIVKPVLRMRSASDLESL